ncbi:MAG: 6-carboxytetrahydropterin synthase [Phycisphaeraceae bacterium]|nr:6-carboxytetrahydropterin synthase [Phycisphaeraceae bacterium]MCW5755535.1 6-carboxytetrahydropterin synthase [Phycisphaeraceae bacterium]
MFQIAVQTEFCAAHALTIAGLVEPVHGHNWRVTAVIAGDALDADGLLCDFHTVEAVLRDITAAWNNRNLNDSEAFNRTSPTAENVAKVIADSLAERLNGSLAPHAWVASVSVTEAPGCVATYLRPHP